MSNTRGLCVCVCVFSSLTLFFKAVHTSALRQTCLFSDPRGHTPGTDAVTRRTETVVRLLVLCQHS